MGLSESEITEKCFENSLGNVKYVRSIYLLTQQWYEDTPNKFRSQNLCTGKTRIFHFTQIAIGISVRMATDPKQ